MENIKITIDNNGTTTLATAGKYCDRNIEVFTDVTVSSVEQAVVGSILDGTITELYNDRVETISERALQARKNLKVAKLPAVKTIKTNGFSGCSNLETVEILGGKLGSIGYQAFSNCKSLKALVIRSMPDSANLTTLSNVNAFDGTPIADGTGFIYIQENPTFGISYYMNATNWNVYASQIKPLSEYEEG